MFNGRLESDTHRIDYGQEAIRCCFLQLYFLFVKQRIVIHRLMLALLACEIKENYQEVAICSICFSDRGGQNELGGSRHACNIEH